MAARLPIVRQGGRARQLAAGDTLDDAVLSPKLRSLAALSPGNNQIPYFTGANTWALASFTVYGRQLVGAADNAAARAILNLGNSATRDVTTGPNDTTSERLIRTNDWVKQTSMYDATPGSLQVVGAFGHGVSSIPAGQYITDADALTVGGKYAVGATWVGSPVAGTAGQNQGSLEHIANFQNTNYAMQRWCSLTLQTPIRRVRAKVNGVWYPWSDDISGEKVTGPTDSTTGRIWVGTPSGMFGIGGTAIARNTLADINDASRGSEVFFSSVTTAENPFGVLGVGLHMNYPGTGRMFQIFGGVVGAVTRLFARVSNSSAVLNAVVELFHTGNFDPDAKANSASPILTGTPRAPTPPVVDNSDRIATMEAVQAVVAAVGDPGAWQTPTWAVGTSGPTLRARLNNGNVEFKDSIIVSASNVGTVFMTLPAGLRPATDRTMLVPAVWGHNTEGTKSTVLTIRFAANGQVTLANTGGSGFVSGGVIFMTGLCLPLS